MVSLKDYADGAKALLGLTKKKAQAQSQDEFVETDALDQNDDDNDQGENVEAALMRIVGGTLNSEAAALEAESGAVETAHSASSGSSSSQQQKKSKRKRSFTTTTTTTNDDISEFQHWNQFLITDQQNEEPHETPVKSKKKRKTRHDPTGSGIVDPELTSIVNDTDHIQLVEDAIMDAGQLEEDVNLNQYIQHPQDDASIESTIQAAQAAAAAVAAQEAELKKQDKRRSAKQSKKKATATLPAVRLQSLQSSSDATINAEATAALVLQAVDRAASIVIPNKNHGAMFTDEEMNAIDNFIENYCRINHWSRTDVCNRVWANTRKKDDFWELIHRILPYRSRASVYKHVRRAYHVFEVRGKWNEEEDEQLSRLVQEKGTQWKFIGELMGRMPEDCRDRWRNYIKCGKERAQNRWSTEEEERLTEIVNKMKGPEEDGTTINWTVVSEEMNGVRSRIQCRYKWNKLLKRDVSVRAASMPFNDRLWMLNKLQELGFDPVDQVNWDALATLQESTQWTGQDLRRCYEKMKQTVKDHKSKSLTEICQALLHEIVEDTEEAPVELPVVFYRGGKVEPAPIDPARQSTKLAPITGLTAGTPEQSNE